MLVASAAMFSVPQDSLAIWLALGVFIEGQKKSVGGELAISGLEDLRRIFSYRQTEHRVNEIIEAVV